MLETLNWLALTVPFFAAAAAYQNLCDRTFPKVLAGAIALVIVPATLFGYGLLYRSYGFPLWMRWFQPAFNELIAEPPREVMATIPMAIAKQHQTQGKLIAYFNTELQRTRSYRALHLRLNNCVNATCNYEVVPGKGHVEIVERNNVVDAVRVIAPMGPGNDFSHEMKALTYLFSLIVWRHLPEGAPYVEANNVMLKLFNEMDSGSNSGVGINAVGNWTFGALPIKCFGSSIMLVGLKTHSDSIILNTNPPEACDQ